MKASFKGLVGWCVLHQPKSIWLPNEAASERPDKVWCVLASKRFDVWLRFGKHHKTNLVSFRISCAETEESRPWKLQAWFVAVRMFVLSLHELSDLLSGTIWITSHQDDYCCNSCGSTTWCVNSLVPFDVPCTPHDMAQASSTTWGAATNAFTTWHPDIDIKSKRCR